MLIVPRVCTPKKLRWTPKQFLMWKVFKSMVRYSQLQVYVYFNICKYVSNSIADEQKQQRLLLGAFLFKVRIYPNRDVSLKAYECILTNHSSQGVDKVLSGLLLFWVLQRTFSNHASTGWCVFSRRPGLLLDRRHLSALFSWLCF